MLREYGVNTAEGEGEELDQIPFRGIYISKFLNCPAEAFGRNHSQKIIVLLDSSTQVSRLQVSETLTRQPIFHWL